MNGDVVKEEDKSDAEGGHVEDSGLELAANAEESEKGSLDWTDNVRPGQLVDDIASTGVLSLETSLCDG